ncbi:hypothetical protein ACT6QH_08975 [Xanthobacter sp. TB0139]|uniref:hypothetical protein n=1 Tax=Xanthobacter sp. TB0139 TaxID=3459178 RepID=UPI0040395CD4
MSNAGARPVRDILRRPGMMRRLLLRFLLGVVLWGLPFGLALAFIAGVGENPWRTVAVSVFIYGGTMSAFTSVLEIWKLREAESTGTRTAPHAP